MVGEWIGVGSLPVESLLGELGIAFFFVGFAVFFALLAFACCCHCYGRCWDARDWEGGVVRLESSRMF